MNNSSDTIGCGWAMGIFIAMLISVSIFWVTTLTSASQNIAVEAGHAEYYLDENNERQWRWKDCK